jgi:hypothetical protein
MHVMRLPLVRTGMFLCLTCVLSCNDNGPNTDSASSTQTQSHEGERRPSFVQGTSFSGTIPVADEHANTGEVALPSYSTPTLVKITLSGLTHMYWNSPPSGMTPQPQPGDLNRNYNVRGAPVSGGCPYGVRIEYGSGWYDMLPPPGCNSAPGPTTDETVEWYMSLPAGTANAARTGGGANNPVTGQPYYRFEGDLNVDVTWVQASADLTADQTSIMPNTSVNFTASVSPTQVSGIAVPFSVVRWRWEPDSGTAVNPVATCSGSTCAYTIAHSGTMFVDVMVNGVADSRSVHITVFPCLTGNPILDDPSVRKGLRDSWAATNSTGPANQRHEVGGALMCSNGVCNGITFPYDPGLGQNACDYHFDPTLAGGGTIYWHMHPFIPADPNDPLPFPPIVLETPITFRQAGSGWPRQVLVMPILSLRAASPI